MHEYKDMAKYYDLFYINKDYTKEVDFLIQIIGKRKTILDVGCGTGIHMNQLEENGYLVDGIDLNKEMLDIARARTKGNLNCANLLDFKTNKKYDAIISMFAVFNHLKSYEELEKGIEHLHSLLNDDGVMIIDLHNGRKNGEKENSIGDNKRIMKWYFDSDTSLEKTDITYKIGNHIYNDSHVFLIYEIVKIKDILNRLKFKYQIYENYTMTYAAMNSKNIQIVIYK